MTGRFAEVAAWILVILGQRPAAAGPILAGLRAVDRPVGVGTFIGALARLERAGLIERIRAEGLPVYRLTKYPLATAR